MKQPVRLSAGFIKSVRESGRYGDGGRGSLGLALLVRPTATGGLSKAFVQRVRLNGRETNIGLGSWPLTTLAEAREAAFNNARAIRNGVDVLSERRKAATVPTFAEAAEIVIALQSGSWKDGSRNAEIWRQRLREYAMPTLGNLRVSAISSADVLACVTPIWNQKNATARKTLHYIAQVLAWAVAHGHIPANVAKGDAIRGALPRHRAEVQHHKALHYTELREALAKVDAADVGETSKLALRFLAYTAARSGEVRGATWGEIDGATWTIPAERTKMGREHRIPLCDGALAAIAAAKQYADGSGLVFPSVTGKVLADSVFSAILRGLSIDSTAHGWRATFRTWAAETGHDRQLAEFALGHVEGSAAERAYQRGDLYERRALLMQAWCAAIA